MGIAHAKLERNGFGTEWYGQALKWVGVAKGFVCERNRFGTVCHRTALRRNRSGTEPVTNGMARTDFYSNGMCCEREMATLNRNHNETMGGAAWETLARYTERAWNVRTRPATTDRVHIGPLSILYAL